MQVADWGGSGELWSKTALLALAQGYDVQSLTCAWNPVSPRIAELRERGIDTQFYSTGDSSSLLDRLAVRFRVVKPKSRILPLLDADVYVISNGNIWDFMRRQHITDYIISAGKPYIIIGHNTLDWGDTVTGQQRDHAIRTLERATDVLFVSERNQKGAERQLAHSIKNSRIIENPVSIRTAFIKPFPESTRLLMASVGTIECSTKGYDLLLEALSTEVWKHRDFELKIYGKGPHEHYLRTLIDFYGLHDKVTLEGHIRDVDRIWETSQVLVLSSVTEGVPMVVVEAMLSGRAVLGTDVGAVERYVEEGKTGFIVPVAKTKYLALGLEDLWNNRANLKQMGAQAFSRATAITNPHPEQTLLDIIQSAGHTLNPSEF